MSIENLIIFSWPRRKELKELALIGQIVPLLPLRRVRQGAHGGNRLKLLGGDDCEKAAVPHDLDDARHLFDAARIEAR